MNGKVGLQKALDGKCVSIFGDSISTYAGVSDNIMANSTLGINKTHYFGNNDGVDSMNETWWGKLILDLQISLLVNNSSSGAKVYGTGNVSLSNVDQGIGDRANNLHCNRGKNNGKTPDIIFVFIGINDFNEGKASGQVGDINPSLLVKDEGGEIEYLAPTNFAEGYYIMLHKIVRNYKDADVFLINMPNREENAPARLIEYNKAISDIAEIFNASVVDLFNSELSGKNYVLYTKGDNLHPDKSGMSVITECVKQTLEIKY